MSLGENSLVAAYQGGQKANSRPSEDEGGDMRFTIFGPIYLQIGTRSVVKQKARRRRNDGHLHPHGNPRRHAARELLQTGQLGACGGRLVGPKKDARKHQLRRPVSGMHEQQKIRADGEVVIISATPWAYAERGVQKRDSPGSTKYDGRLPRKS